METRCSNCEFWSHSGDSTKEWGYCGFLFPPYLEFMMFNQMTESRDTKNESGCSLHKPA